MGNCAEALPELARRGVVPDLLTDQTSAHDPLNGYIPAGQTVEQAAELRARDPQQYLDRSLDSIATHVRAMLDLQRAGAVTFDYGNNIRRFAADRGVADAFQIPGFVPEYIRPLFCEGRGPFRWVALSGEPSDIAATDQLICRLFASSPTLTRWISLAQQKVHFQGLPARICWLGYGERAQFALEMNRMVATGKLKAPIVIGRDHLDCGSVASPYRETEAMLRRKRRHRRLAHLERPAQHRLRRKLGFGAQWRRRGHRLFATCRTSHGGRRHRSIRALPGARDDLRSRYRRSASRGCRLSGSHRLRRRRRIARPYAARVTR